MECSHLTAGALKSDLLYLNSKYHIHRAVTRYVYAWQFSYARWSWIMLQFSWVTRANTTGVLYIQCWPTDDLRASPREFEMCLAWMLLGSVVPLPDAYQFHPTSFLTAPRCFPDRIRYVRTTRQTLPELARWFRRISD
jgi:hypothetical protein